MIPCHLWIYLCLAWLLVCMLFYFYLVSTSSPLYGKVQQHQWLYYKAQTFRQITFSFYDIVESIQEINYLTNILEQVSDTRSLFYVGLNLLITVIVSIRKVDLQNFKALFVYLWEQRKWWMPSLTRMLPLFSNKCKYVHEFSQPIPKEDSSFSKVDIQD